jgi:DnaJ-class molecular chaperone
MDKAETKGFVDFYELLGVHPKAELHDIRQAYIRLAKRHHPDAGGSIEMMQGLNDAYRTLSSSTKKAAYDLLHSFHTGSTGPGAYRYGEGREVSGMDDLTDDEIDTFLDNVFAEYRNGPPKQNVGFRHRLRRFFDI